MLRLYWARFLRRIDEKTFRCFLAVRYQKTNPYWMADRREYRDHGAFFWIMRPSRRFYADQRNPYIVG